MDCKLPDSRGCHHTTTGQGPEPNQVCVLSRSEFAGKLSLSYRKCTMQLSKTDFIKYLQCPKSLWLLLKKPEMYPHGEFSDYAKKLAAEGYEVEAYVKALLGKQDDSERFSFQTVFETERGLYAKADVVRVNEDGTINLYEIKSSTSVKADFKHNQIKDACFQTLAAEECGRAVSKVFIVHLNGDYVRQGEIDESDMLVFADVTQRVREVQGETGAQIAEALSLLGQPEIDASSCTCLTLTRSNHCDSFDIFNPAVPSPSIYDLPRISRSKLEKFVEDGRFCLDEISFEEVTAKQALVLQSAQFKEAIVNQDALAAWFSKAEYPLYFLDYETYASAVPILDGARPQAPIPFQYSLHIKRTPDDLELVHAEYLADQAALPLQMIEHMERRIGATGSVISWHSSFENTQNKTMSKQFPSKAGFLQSLIDRTLDLEDIFSTAYVDIAFGGSTSIKKVLPVLADDLDYKDMEVASGTDAMEAWKRLIGMEPGEAREELRASMLEYCKLDTYAMVRLFEEMERV